MTFIELCRNVGGGWSELHWLHVENIFMAKCKKDD